LPKITFMNITQTELEQLKALQESIVNLTQEIGVLSYKAYELSQQKEQQHQLLQKTVNQQQELESELFIKYGAGALNLETGEITPLTEQ
jgi:hypothetical protein